MYFSMYSSAEENSHFSAEETLANVFQYLIFPPQKKNAAAMIHNRGISPSIVKHITFCKRMKLKNLN